MTPPADGIHVMVARDAMTPSARKLRDTYAITPGIPLLKREFGFYSLDAWAEQGMPHDVSHADLFDLEPPGSHSLGQLGWCEAGLCPVFETTVLEDRGAYELVQDFAGRQVLFFKGRRDGFMPEYVDHPVKDMRSFEEKIAWRMDPKSPGRYVDLDERMSAAGEAAGRGLMMTQNLVGGYMYLRSLFGPEELLYALLSGVGETELSPLRGQALAAALHRRLDDWLAAVHDSGRYTVALVDEAHALRDRRSLEAVRMLLSPSPGGGRLMTVILAGQQELASRVARFAPLDDRIEVRAGLRPLTEDEAANYLLRRIEIAGGRRGVFTRKGAAAVAAAAKCVPGALNRIAEACLVTAFAAGLDRVGPDVVAAVLEDMKTDAPAGAAPGGGRR